MTYNGRGVAQPGVVKQHHAIIHTSESAPDARSDELPEHLPEGGSGPGMLSWSIRVQPRRRGVEGYALDPLARLYYGGIHSFSNDVTVKIFGVVHQMSRQNFEMSFRRVWRQTNPYPSMHHDRQTLGQDQPRQQPALAGPSIPRPFLGQAARPRNDSVISTAELSQMLEEIRLWAENEGLPALPPVDDARRDQMAQDPSLRKWYFDKLRSRYSTLSETREATEDNQTGEEATEENEASADESEEGDSSTSDDSEDEVTRSSRQ